MPRVVFPIPYPCVAFKHSTNLPKGLLPPFPAGPSKLAMHAEFGGVMTGLTGGIMSEGGSSDVSLSGTVPS